MENRNQGLQNSLRCLQHPISLISIAVLIINDHFLKIVSPSWLTGKLSDFAGLFFFPFVAAATFSLLLRKSKSSAYFVGQLAFGFVAAWFTLIKILPFVNSLTARVASAVIGSSAHFSLDPTDIFALLAMLPAWKLWNWQKEAKPPQFGYVVLVIGGLAAIATSPRAWEVSSVTDLEYSKDGIVYAADRETFGKDTYPIAKSLDGGLTWEYDNNKDNLEGKGEKIYPIEDCRHDLNEFGYKVCYRVTNDHRLQASYDSGQHWYDVFSRNSISIRALDMVIISLKDKEYLLVAIGENGVLRRELPNGNWEIISVLYATTR